MEHVVVFGSTGRVGAAAVQQALADGHAVTAVARTPSKIVVTHPELVVVRGDTLDPDDVAEVLKGATGATAVLMAVGVDPLKESDVVTRTVRNLVRAMPVGGIERYLGITGTAQLQPHGLGRLTQAVVRRVIKAASDHQGAYDAVVASDLDYVLAACPYIKDGAHPGRWSEHLDGFPGGYRTIAPGDVAAFLVGELTRPRHHRRAVGIW